MIERQPTTDPKTVEEEICLRPATASDVPNIKSLLDDFAEEDLLLSKTLSELYETVRDFVICEVDGTFAGTGALHVIWEDLAELRSFAVSKKFQGRGLGGKIAKRLLEDAKGLGMGRVFALTYATPFFEALGFRVLDKTLLPKKIWADCIHCHKFPMCDEVAMIVDFRPYPEGPVGPPPELPQIINLEKLVPGIIHR